MSDKFTTIDEFWNWIHAIPVREVNLSSSFMMRGRCKYCSGTATTYHNIRLGSFFITPYEKINSTNWVKECYKKTNVDVLIGLPPSTQTKLSDFTVQANYKGYAPRLHRTQGLKTNMAECASCDCNRAIWVIPNMYNILPEHIHRRAPYEYSSKIRYEY